MEIHFSCRDYCVASAVSYRERVEPHPLLSSILNGQVSTVEKLIMVFLAGIVTQPFK